MKFRLSTLLVVLALCCATMGLFVRNLWAVILALTIFFAVFLFAEDLWELKSDSVTKRINAVLSSRLTLFAVIFLAAIILAALVLIVLLLFFAPPTPPEFRNS